METDDDEDDTPSLKVKIGKRGLPLAPCGRPSFGSNPVNKIYNSRYRNPDNENRFQGRLPELGKATGIIAFTLFGFGVSLEVSAAADQRRIFESAAW